MGCMKLLGLIALGSAIGFSYLWYKIEEVPEIPVIAETFWGSGTPKPDSTAIKSFKINIPDAALEDLIRRLNNTRKFTSPLEGIGFQYGMNSEYLNNLVTYWRTEYNWRKREVFLNQFPQFQTQVSGLNIHFIHAKPDTSKLKPGTKVLPLLLLHGWPGSVREFYDIIPMLTTPRQDENFVFEVIAPSLPGYGFSEGATKPGMGAMQVSIIMKKLMDRLGYKTFYIQGGDWGSIIGKSIALFYPESVKGYHSNMCIGNSKKNQIKTMIGFVLPSLIAEEGHEERLAQQLYFMLEETGYMHLQATKPDTVGAALTDSPAGLAAYILEKFSTWTSPTWRSKSDGGLHYYSKDNLLDNIMIYWLTGSITTSMRLYSETFNKQYRETKIDQIPITVASGCARFPNELMYVPRSFIEDGYKNLVRLTDMPKGGHFAAFEVPQLLAQDVWEFVKEVNEKEQKEKKK